MKMIAVHVPAVATAEKPLAFEITDFDTYAIPKPNLPVVTGEANDLVLYFDGLEEMDDYYSTLVETEFYRDRDSMKYKKIRVILEEFCAVSLFEHLKVDLPEKTYEAKGAGTRYCFTADTLQVNDQAPQAFRLLLRQSGFYLEYGPEPLVLQVVSHLNKTFELFTPDGARVALLHPEGERIAEFGDI